MAHAYTPGLRVAELTVVRKERRLPLPGEVLVKLGAHVKAAQVVARTELPGNVESVNVANRLGVPPEDVPQCMLKKEGDSIEKGEVIAQSKSFFGLFKSSCQATVTGTVETVSSVTGQVLLREPPLPVEVRAYVDGIVADVLPGEGVVVETPATFIQGIFGIGGEIQGQLVMVVASADEILDADRLTEAVRGKVAVGGSLVTAAAIRKAIAVGAKGILAGGLHDKDLREFLGYDLGVAITGNEDKGVTLIVTEGFGKIRMAEATFNLLKRCEGMECSMNGATQIRAGVIRPEVVIPRQDKQPTNEEAGEGAGNMVVGSQVRVIREPYFGRLGTVSLLPSELQRIESETMVRVLEVRFGDGTQAIIPRANVELIEK
ncbi:MAG: hypothetical protein MUE60_03170 [Candidatus Eisenbacteria bacterium]|nr:hypothetical protein [Candidatus Eisenbacteria bacterium]